MALYSITRPHVKNIIKAITSKSYRITMLVVDINP